MKVNKNMNNWKRGRSKTILPIEDIMEYIKAPKIQALQYPYDLKCDQLIKLSLIESDEDRIKNIMNSFTNSEIVKQSQDRKKAMSAINICSEGTIMNLLQQENN